MRAITGFWGKHAAIGGIFAGFSHFFMETHAPVHPDSTHFAVPTPRRPVEKPLVGEGIPIIEWFTAGTGRDLWDNPEEGLSLQNHRACPV